MPKYNKFGKNMNDDQFTIIEELSSYMEYS